MLHETKNYFEITISSPETKVHTVKFEFSSAGNYSRGYLFNLPRGEAEVGRSVT